jgi:hypothetical protein
MSRIRWSFALALVLLAVLGSRPARASTLDANMIKVALHTATPEEDGFIERVVVLVDRHKLPLDLVQSTFIWARKKPRNKFQYFKRALLYRAAKRGISL